LFLPLTLLWKAQRRLAGVAVFRQPILPRSAIDVTPVLGDTQQGSMEGATRLGARARDDADATPLDVNPSNRASLRRSRR